jgi:hypothetical protein
VTDPDWRDHCELLEQLGAVTSASVRAYRGEPAAQSPFAWTEDTADTERLLRGMVLDCVRLQLAAGTDHAAGVAALLRSKTTSNAFFVVVRSVLDALAPAWWILEPGTRLTEPGALAAEPSEVPQLTMRTTAARLLCYLAADARQYRQVPDGVGGFGRGSGAETRFDRYVKLAEVVAQADVARSPAHKDWTVAAQKWLGFGALAGDLCSVLDQPAPARNPYNFLSGLAHAHPTFVTAGAVEVESPAPTRIMQFSPRPHEIDRWCRYVARAGYAVSLAVYAAHGWPVGPIHGWYDSWRDLPTVDWPGNDPR